MMQSQILRRFTTTARFPTSHLRTTAISAPRSSFSTFSPRLASEAPKGGFEAYTETPYSEASIPLYDRLQMYPEALEAITNLSKLAKEKTGVDLSSGEKPSMKMMMAFSNDPELRGAAEALMKALEKAGIQVDPKQALAALKTMGGKGFEGVGEDGNEGTK